MFEKALRQFGAGQKCCISSEREKLSIMKSESYGCRIDFYDGISRSISSSGIDFDPDEVYARLQSTLI